MDLLQVPNGTNSAKTKAVEAARKMQTSVIDAANKQGRDPPKYVLIEIIGKGSFGVVYKGKDVTTTDVVAVKIIDIDESDTADPRNADSYGEFLKEISALKVLREHKARNINHVVDALSVGKTVWIITEYCGGGSVATLMKPTSPGGLLEKWIIPILREVAEALKWVHTAGIIHRDIKCANVLITEHGEVKLCDFGVAGTLETKLEKRSTFIGTPHWMAPELFETSRNYGKEVDIWAFGAMVYEIATGLPPNVKNCISYQNLGRHLKVNVPRLEDDSFSEDLKGLVAYCLQPLPCSRPTIEQVQRHAYIYNSDSKYPTSSLTELIQSYAIWERQGNERKSLMLSGEDSGPSENVAAEEWNFDTRVAIDQTIPLNTAEQDIQETNELQLKSDSTPRLEPYVQGPLPRRSGRQPPPQVLAPLQSPLEKAFDPNTISNYEDNSRKYYDLLSTNSEPDVTVRRADVTSSFQNSLIDLGDFGSGNTMAPASIGLGIRSIPERRPTWHGEEDGYMSTATSHRKPIRSGSDLTAYQPTQGWNLPLSQQNNELATSPVSLTDQGGESFGGSFFGGCPSLIHYPTDPTGSQLRSDLTPPTPRNPGDWFSLRQSLIDLDLGIPEFYSPLSSMLGSDVGSKTPRSPLDLVAPDLPIEKSDRQPSLYVDDVQLESGNREPSLYVDDPQVDAQNREPSLYADEAIHSYIDPNLGDVVGSPSTLSVMKDYDSTPLFEVEDVSKDPQPLAVTSESEFRQSPTSAHFPGIVDPPSVAALYGDLSNYEMAKEVTRMIDGLTEQLVAFRDVYDSHAIKSMKTTASRESLENPPSG